MSLWSQSLVLGHIEENKLSLLCKSMSNCFKMEDYLCYETANELSVSSN